MFTNWHEFVQFAPVHKVAMSEIWQLMSKLVQFTDVHFPDLSPNSYENLNNMKWNLSVSTTLAKFIANNFRIFSLKTRVITAFL